MNEETKLVEENSDATLKEFFLFIRGHKGKFLFLSTVSLVIAALLFVCYCVFSPRTNTYDRDIILALSQNGEGKTIYPSGTPFTEVNVISSLVLKEVYRKNQLQNRIGLDEFCTMFSVTSKNEERRLLEAEYNAKMGKKNISVADIDRLGREYKENLKSLRADKLNISMASSLQFTPAEAAKILNDIPVKWYEVYSGIEGAKMSSIGMDAQIRALQQKSPNKLLAVEKAYECVSRLSDRCGELEALLNGKNITLPSGESLNDVRQSLNNVNSYQISVLRQLVLAAPAFLSNMDKAFVDGKLHDLESKHLEQSKQYEGIMKMIDVFRSNRDAGKNAAAGTGAPAAVQTADSNLTLDSVFLSSYGDLIRKDVNAESIKTYVKLLEKCGDDCAKTEAELAFYRKMFAYMNGKAEGGNRQPLNEAEYTALLNDVCTELLSASTKLNELQKLMRKEYLTEGTFFIPYGNVVQQTSYPVPTGMVLIGIIALWILFNGLFLLFDFISARSGKTQDA